MTMNVNAMLKAVSGELKDIPDEAISLATALDEWADGKPMIVTWHHVVRLVDDHGIALAALQIVATPIGGGLYQINGGGRTEAVPLNLLARHYDERAREARRIAARHNNVA